MILLLGFLMGARLVERLETAIWEVLFVRFDTDPKRWD